MAVVSSQLIVNTLDTSGRTCPVFEFAKAPEAATTAGRHHLEAARELEAGRRPTADRPIVAWELPDRPSRGRPLPT